MIEYEWWLRLDFGLDRSADNSTPVWLVVGVFVGSALWWLLLSSGVSLLRRRMTPRILGWINRVAGSLIAPFGTQILVDLIRTH